MAAQAPRSVVLGTAGHIDHGKTSLVHALTGVDTDRLPEEKARGMTIDLGFAALHLPGTQGDTLFHLVDVPGHHAFLRNMLAGAGGIDCALLVVAANEGPKPQTVEHLAICGLLGLRHGLVVLTKSDLVSPERLAAARAEVSALVRGTFLADAPVLAVSARTGEGLGELKRALAALGAQVAPPREDTVPRLPIDRAFAVRGFGAVVTGTLQAGALAVGDTLDLLPERGTVRVRGLQLHGHAAAEAQAPARVALNLADVEVAALHRGEVLCPAGTLAPAAVLDVELTALPGVPLPAHRSRVRVHAFTAETIATVLHFPPPAGGAAGPVLARLKLREPLVLVPGDRFILRRLSPAATVGGGSVLDAYPQPRRRKAVTRSWLEQVREADDSGVLLARVERRGPEGLSLRQLVAETGLREQVLQTLAAPLVAAGQLLASQRAGGRLDALLWPGSLQAAVEAMGALVSRAKTQGLARAELVSQSRLPPWVFALAWNRLGRDSRFEATATGIRLRSAGPPGDRRLAVVEALYRQAGLASPIVSEAAAALHLLPRDLPPLLTQLLRAGKLLRLGSDNLLVHTAAVEELRARLGRHRGESFDVARFKAFTGLSRKHAIPLLEYLDGARVTRNGNGVRTVL